MVKKITKTMLISNINFPPLWQLSQHLITETTAQPSPFSEQLQQLFKTLITHS